VRPPTAEDGRYQTARKCEASGNQRPSEPGARVPWTDDYSNLFRILKYW